MVVIVVVVGAIFVNSKLNNTPAVAQQNNVEYYHSIAPSRQQASQVVQTSSRIYYVEKATSDDVYFTPLAWYEYNKDTWQRREKPLPLKKTEIIIYQR